MDTPELVLISGGREMGGLQSFAEGLAQGFERIGVPARVMSDGDWWDARRRWRDPRVMKILSTRSVFLAPLMRRTVCVAHGFPRVDGQGVVVSAGVVASLKLAQHCSTLVTVSDYVALHLAAVFGIRCAGVIQNALPDRFFRPRPAQEPRDKITFLGRMHVVKNVHRLLPSVLQVLAAHPELELVIAGDGPERARLEALCAHHPRVRFPGPLGAEDVLRLLARTRVLFSGCETEAIGTVYLEALSQGCAVVMPACGGGLDLAPRHLGRMVFPFPLSFDADALREVFEAAIASPLDTPPDMTRFRAEAVARQYLAVCGARAGR